MRSRQLEAVLRPRAALTLEKVSVCRQIRGFGDCEPWPPDHVFQPETDGRRGERIQVYAEVRNFRSKLVGVRPGLRDGRWPEWWRFAILRTRNTSSVYASTSRRRWSRSQTPRQDYFVNFQLNAGTDAGGAPRCTQALVGDMLALVGDDSRPARGRSDRSISSQAPAPPGHDRK